MKTSQRFDHSHTRITLLPITTNLEEIPMRLRMFAVMFVLLSVSTAARQEQQSADHAAPEYPGFTSVEQRRAIGLKHSFSTSMHVDMVQNDPIARKCTEVLAAAQWRQDILLALDSTAHYDNCQFDAATAYVHTLLDRALAAGSKNNQDEALANLGRALHGIQDFYSHTNYVELSASRHTKIKDVDIIPVWTEAGRRELQTLVTQGLVSGHVWWELGATCTAPRRSHEDLNKDRPDSLSGRSIIDGWNVSRHQAARALALEATRAFLRDAFSRKELKPVAVACHEKIGFLLLTDNRRGER